MAGTDPEPDEFDREAWALVAEMLNCGSVLFGLFRRMKADLSAETLKGQPPEAVILEMMVGSSLPALRKAGTAECRRTTELLRAVQDRVLSDLRLAMELADRRP